MKSTPKPLTHINQAKIIPFAAPTKQHEEQDGSSIFTRTDDLDFKSAMLDKRLNMQLNDPQFLKKQLRNNRSLRKCELRRLRIEEKEELKKGKKSSFQKRLHKSLARMDQEEKEILSALEKWQPVLQTTPTLRGAMEISKAAGIKAKDVKSFVALKELPAFKIPTRKFWFAFPEEVERWKEKQEITIKKMKEACEVGLPGSSRKTGDVMQSNWSDIRHDIGELGRLENARSHEEQLEILSRAAKAMKPFGKWVTATLEELENTPPAPLPDNVIRFPGKRRDTKA